MGGHEYEGDWYQGMKSGTGILKFANGDVYKGMFKSDNFHREGIYFYKNGDKFEGDWKNG